jgi:hypothetical protein
MAWHAPCFIGQPAAVNRTAGREVNPFARRCRAPFQEEKVVMSANHPVKPLKPRVARQGDTASVKSREDRTNDVATTAPSSPIWQAQSSMQAAGKKLITAGANLTAGSKLVDSLEAQLTAARTALGGLTLQWDQAYDGWVVVVEEFTTLPAEITALGTSVLDVTKHPLLTPLEVTATYDPKKALIRVHVHRAAGNHPCIVEISPDPIAPGSFKRVTGNAAKRALAGYAPGTWWVRAAVSNATDESGFTTPVAVIVK